MKIVLFDFWNVINSTGGAEKVLCNMANELAKRGYDVSVIVCDPKKGRPFFYLADKVKFINLNGTGKFAKGGLLLRIERELFRILGVLDKDKMYIKTRFDNHIKQNLQKLIDEIAPDILISFDPKSVMVLKYLLKNTLPTIAMLHMEAKYFFHKDISKVLLDSYNAAKCIQVLIKNYIAVAKQYCQNVSVVYIPNTVDIKVEKDNQVDSVYNKIINVGRIDGNHKQQLLLIQAFNKLKDKYPKWIIEIWGGTYTEKQVQYKKQILQYIKEHNLQNRDYLKGETQDIAGKLSKADIFAFPSKFEGMPLALMEAMSVGLPAIGYKSCASVNELIVSGYNGFLCNDGTDDFAEKLKILMSDDGLRNQMGENARASMQTFAPEKIWDAWEALIKDVAAKHSRI